MVDVPDERVGPNERTVRIFLKYDGGELTDKRPLEHYVNELKRLLNVIEQQLEHRDYLAGDYSIADIAIVPWLNCLDVRYGATDITQLRK
ncbi:MAG: glutathione S-transferase C-terminal domain-containing protein [Granulosicoccaceae bacterium]